MEPDAEVGNAVAVQAPDSSLHTPQVEVPVKRSEPDGRLQWIDFVKAQNIFYVVLIHVHRGMIGSGVFEETNWSHWTSRFLGSFVMPGFFFMSGLFIVSSASKPFKVFLRDKWQTIVYPYFLWATLYSVILVGMNNWTNREQAFSSIWLLIYEPPGHFWFMYTIFLSMVLFAIALRLNINPLGFFVLSVAFYCTSFFPEINLGKWGVVFMVRHSMLYLALGALVGRNGKVLRWLNRARSWQVGAVVTVCYPFTLWGVMQGGRDILWANPFLAVSGCAGTFCVAILLSRTGRFKSFEFLGRHSMEIYVAHVFGLAGVRIFLEKVLGIENAPLHFVLGTLGGVYVPIAIGYVAYRIGFPYLYSLRKQKVRVVKKTIVQP